MTRLSATGLAVRQGGRDLLAEVSLELRPGELVGIIGPNGAGKSTLLRCLAGLLRPQAGGVALDGRALGGIPSRERARLIGYVPQRFEPAWDYSVREILDLGAGRSAGSGARLPAVARDYELDDLLDRRWSRLSGGERARALLASVTVGDPPVLLADEPGASLDIRHRLALLARLRVSAGSRVVAVALHDLDLAARYCHRLVVLEEGRIRLDDGHREVGTSAALDAVFGVDFGRIEVDRDARHVLPVVSREL